MSPVRSPRLASLRLAPLVLGTLALASAHCGDSGTFPLALEVKEAANAGRRADELEIIARTVPGAELTFEGQTKAVGEKATETFVVPKGSLKLGKNAFHIEGKRGVLLSTERAKADAVWEATAKSFVRLVPTGGDGALGALSCAGPLCGGPSFKIGKNGRIVADAEAFAAGWLSVAGRREGVAPAGKKTFEIDVLASLGTLPLAQPNTLPVPIVFELGDAKASETLTLTGPVLTDLLVAELAKAAAGPVSFGKDDTAAASPRAVAVVGAPAQKLIVVGKAARATELDWVAVAKPAERFFSCGGAATSASGIQYKDLEISAYDRRGGLKVFEKKLLADRVACPDKPTPGAIEAHVREADIVRAVTAVLQAPPTEAKGAGPRARPRPVF